MMTMEWAERALRRTFYGVDYGSSDGSRVAFAVAERNGPRITIRGAGVGAPILVQPLGEMRLAIARMAKRMDAFGQAASITFSSDREYAALDALDEIQALTGADRAVLRDFALSRNMTALARALEEE